jgi:hypothetical protein
LLERGAELIERATGVAHPHRRAKPARFDFRLWRGFFRESAGVPARRRP